MYNMYNIKALEFSINLSLKNSHYPELNSQPFTKNGTVIQLCNNVSCVNIIMHKKGTFSVDEELENKLSRQTRKGCSIFYLSGKQRKFYPI